MFQLDSVHPAFAKLRTKHPDLATELSDAEQQLVKWAMAPTINDPQGAAAIARTHVEDTMFCGNAEKLKAVTLIPDAFGRPGYLVAHIAAREGLSPDLAYTLAVDTHNAARRAECDFNFDTWRLMSHDAISQKLGELYGHVVITAMQDTGAEPNLVYAMSEHKMPPEDLRPQHVLRLQTVCLGQPTWTVLERISTNPDHAEHAFDMHLFIDAQAQYNKNVQAVARQIEKQSNMANAYGMGIHQSMLDAHVQQMARKIDSDLFKNMMMPNFPTGSLTGRFQNLQQAQAAPPPPLQAGSIIHTELEDMIRNIGPEKRQSFLEGIVGRIKKPGDKG